MEHVELATPPEIIPLSLATDAATVTTQANEAMAVIKAVRGILEPMAEFIAAIDRIYGPAVRIMNRYTKLHQHRRHQDERRCYAKQARRERTGWRQR
ncbi:MAG: hypothetical protein KBF47_18565 [Gemmatimonadales bacterium]|nr:hypothetical protein [Gemmatimonadales bacterium]